MQRPRSASAAACQVQHLGVARTDSTIMLHAVCWIYTVKCIQEIFNVLTITSAIVRDVSTWRVYTFKNLDRFKYLYRFTSSALARSCTRATEIAIEIVKMKTVWCLDLYRYRPIGIKARCTMLRGVAFAIFYTIGVVIIEGDENRVGYAQQCSYHILK